MPCPVCCAVMRPSCRGWASMRSRSARASASAVPARGRASGLPGPLCPDTLAQNIVQGHVRDLEMGCNGAMRAVATAGVFGTQVTGMADGTDLDTTEHDTGCGQVTRTGRVEDTRGNVHALAVTV